MLTGLKILVADDDVLNQKVINFMLKKKGALVTTAVNGREAIDALGREQIDVVLMDLQMPGMDGYAAAEFIRKNLGERVPIIALTADPFADESDEFRKSGMNACMCKPVDPAQLCDLILTLRRDIK